MRWDLHKYANTIGMQVNTANFLILHIFKQSLTFVHKKYIGTYKLFTRCFVGALRITAATFVHLQWTTFPDYPSTCIVQSLCNGCLYLVFRALMRFHDCSWKKTRSYLVSLYCSWFTCHSAVTDLYDLKRLCIKIFHASHGDERLSTQSSLLDHTFITSAEIHIN